MVKRQPRVQRVVGSIPCRVISKTLKMKKKDFPCLVFRIVGLTLRLTRRCQGKCTLLTFPKSLNLIGGCYLTKLMLRVSKSPINQEIKKSINR